jgi:HSP20 family molecular chaperone IbpA
MSSQLVTFAVEPWHFLCARPKGTTGTYRSERHYGSFYRAIPLPEDADPNQAQAHFKDGVLEITVPVPERQRASQGRKIDVQS